MKTAEKLDLIIKEEYKNINGMLVVQKGDVIFENIITVTVQMMHFI